jgi:hypothetical protein
MNIWERNICPDCSYIWERDLDGTWRYISLIAVPVPEERTCPVCNMNMHIKWVSPLPTLPQKQKD